MSHLGMARMLTALMPEELLLEKTIEALQKYQTEKYGTEEVKVSDTLAQEKPKSGGLADFFKSNSHQPSNTITNSTEVKKPISELMTLIMKFQDDGKSVYDIMEDSEKLEDIITQMEDK